MVATIEPLLIKSADAASALSLGKRTLWTLTNMKEIPCVRQGRSVLYDPNDLRAWVEAKKTA